MIARRHMHDYGTQREHLAAVAVKNHENGALNPDAQMRKVITLEQAMRGKPIADPLNLYDCSLISDGAAAVILVPNWIEQPEPGGVNWTTRKPLSKGKSASSRHPSLL